MRYFIFLLCLSSYLYGFSVTPRCFVWFLDSTFLFFIRSSCKEVSKQLVGGSHVCLLCFLNLPQTSKHMHLLTTFWSFLYRVVALVYFPTSLTIILLLSKRCWWYLFTQRASSHGLSCLFVLVHWMDSMNHGSTDCFSSFHALCDLGVVADFGLSSSR